VQKRDGIAPNFTRLRPATNSISAGLKCIYREKNHKHAVSLTIYYIITCCIFWSTKL